METIERIDIGFNFCRSVSVKSVDSGDSLKMGQNVRMRIYVLFGCIGVKFLKGGKPLENCYEDDKYNYVFLRLIFGSENK